MPHLDSEQMRGLASRLRIFEVIDESVKSTVIGLASLMRDPTADVPCCAWREDGDLHALALDGDRLIHVQVSDGSITTARLVHRDQVIAVEVDDVSDLDQFSGWGWHVLAWRITLADGAVHTPRAKQQQAEKLADFVSNLMPA